MSATMINENATVRTYKGEDICHECGRCIRNIVEIDGVAYGVRCCEKYLPRTHKVIAGAVVCTETPMQTAQRVFGDDVVFTRFWAKPIDVLEQFIVDRPDSVRCAGVRAIIAAKSAYAGAA